MGPEPCCIGIYISLGVLRLTLPLRILCVHCLGRELCADLLVSQLPDYITRCVVSYKEGRFTVG